MRKFYDSIKRYNLQIIGIEDRVENNNYRKLLEDISLLWLERFRDTIQEKVWTLGYLTYYYW